MIDGDAVVHELVLPVPAEQAFDMFTDPQRLVRWIGISADLEARCAIAASRPGSPGWPPPS